MADINNPEALKYVREIIRPLCERYRAEYYRDKSALTTWFGGVNTLIPNTADPIQDGRENEGVSRLTGADVNSVVTQFAAFVTAMEQSGVLDVISKPCVRQLME